MMGSVHTAQLNMNPSRLRTAGRDGESVLPQDERTMRPRRRHRTLPCLRFSPTRRISQRSTRFLSSVLLLSIVWICLLGVNAAEETPTIHVEQIEDEILVNSADEVAPASTSASNETASTSSTNLDAPTATAIEEEDDELDMSTEEATDDAQEPQSPVQSSDAVEDSLYDPIQADPDCDASDGRVSCNELPETTIEEEVLIDATCSYGGDDPDSEEATGTAFVDSKETSARETAATTKGEKDDKTCEPTTLTVDKHWGSDPNILNMRDKLRQSGTTTSNSTSTKTQRPPIFLMPGLASTRLIAWRYKACPQNPLLSNIKVQDNVWLNINLVVQMSTIDVSCMQECLKLGLNQSDTDSLETGCKLRPDEGLDAISSLSPGGIGSSLLVGGTNTVYAWLIQWLADNLGYDVSNIVGLPYDWRLSPDKLQDRDGFLTLTRRRIEAAVQANGRPGIMVAHSMGNMIFRYFLEWLRTQLRQEAYERYLKQAERRAKAVQKQAGNVGPDQLVMPSSFLPGWMSGIVSGFDEWWYNRKAASGAAFESSETYGDGPTSSFPDKHPQLWELAQLEGDDLWLEWIEQHLWTYVGLSAPMLGAVNPLRAVVSGENMGLPVTDEAARIMELSFGSTHVVNPISTREGFCDQWDAERWDEEPSPEATNKAKSHLHSDARLACLDDVFTNIEYSSRDHNLVDPWKNYPALRALMRERRDWDSDFPMIQVVKEYCEEKEKTPCADNSTHPLGPKDVQTGNLFTQFSDFWKEEGGPLIVKREQLRESFWDNKVSNMLNRTWERPLIKHVIMAYGVDIPTEVAYVYRKTERKDQKEDKEEVEEEQFDGIPHIEEATWEISGGRLEEERMDAPRGSLADLLTKKKPKRLNRRQGSFEHSGDGSVPYLSLAWAHTWLLHAVRAMHHSGTYEGPTNPLNNVKVSHRPKGAMEWHDGPPPPRIEILGEKKVEESSDTGTAHPHGTKYKPEMVRYHNQGTSRTTGIEYTTTVIEAIGVEHKETTRNYDILAAVFTDVLKFMHDDLQV